MVLPCDGRTNGSSCPKPSKISTICIIGAGPSGLACAKYLRAEDAFSEIKIFEQRARVGGLWNYTALDRAPESLAIPQTSPHAGLDKPIWDDRHTENGRSRRGHEEPAFMSPVYDRLETNIPRELMGFSDLDWPQSCQLFPKHESVLEYLECYAQDIQDLIEFQTQVCDVRLGEDGRWVVRTQRLSKTCLNPPQDHVFDAVVIASGHFDVPYIPAPTGIEDWNQAHPGTILHSKFYRSPESYADKKVIIVGNSASGVDIASQVSGYCKLPLLQSQKSESFLQPEQSPTKTSKPEIIEYIPAGRKVRFADGSVEEGVDAIVYCTGYFYCFPFLRTLAPPVINTGECVEKLYQHIFYRHEPTLAFVALNQKIVPFPVAEAQSAVIARVWAGRLTLPSEREMERWEKSALQETGGGRKFHVLNFPRDAEYINMLHDWALSADREAGGHHGRRLERSPTMGKRPPYWGEKEYWARERFPGIKKAFQSFGEDRRTRRRMEDVGFSFEEWKKERVEEAKTLL